MPCIVVVIASKTIRMNTNMTKRKFIEMKHTKNTKKLSLRIFLPSKYVVSLALIYLLIKF